MEATSSDPSLLVQSLILAASTHDLPAVRSLLLTVPAKVRDPETGITPLHACIASFESSTPATPSTPSNPPNGTSDGVNSHTYRKEELEDAAEIVRLLFRNGAIWNELDGKGETPGCVARRLGLEEIYGMVVEAGVRAELLFSRLGEYQVLAGGESEEEEEDDDEEYGGINGGVEEDARSPQDGQLATDNTADVNSADYLRSGLTFTEDKLLDDESNGVMMAWEKDIMQRTAELILPAPNLRVLNVGHGMGIIDTIFQEKNPASHHIIEAHPSVLDQMRRENWHDKPGVVIHEGRWQDVVPILVDSNTMFDAIYFDTFAEDYTALKDFFSEYVIGLLDPAGGSDGNGGVFAFFNGLGADRQVCYDVYGKISEMDLFQAGFDTEWETIDIPDLDRTGEWDGVRRRYWTLSKYKLPTCRFIG
ncbi:arginine N-methyltransferas-like protein [Patellaria atrata CBS 101060]|uniref:Arginine N-methyltransferase 2 n=1 Tax=Patellaria atrata CBS 101060 TaxID=1346257 RepID=A0A9P4S481_9PEZI|nr:arginine N-methyltransferas-like protein [Patellaria atrata CBS 101060]